MKTRELTIAALFTALISVGAWISIPIGAVSITMQTFFVMMAGLLLPWKNALLSVVVYLILGILGLPIFAGGTGGLGIFAKPSVGFLLGFIPLVLIVAMAQKQKVQFRFLNLIVANIVLYGIGFAYMYVYFNVFVEKPMKIVSLLQAGVLPYLPGDLLKIIVTFFLCEKLVKKK